MTVPVAERIVRINNRLGLHARPAAALVQLANRFESTVEVVRGELRVNGKSIMGVLMLAAERGTDLRLVAKGPDASAAVSALAELVGTGFGDYEEDL